MDCARAVEYVILSSRARIEGKCGGKTQAQGRKLNDFLFFQSRRKIIGRYARNCSLLEMSFLEVDTKISQRETTMSELRRESSERTLCLGLFNQRRKNSRPARRIRAVGFVQSAVRMYECTYAYFMFIYIWMCMATCSRRHSGLSNGARRSAAPDRHFSIPVGIYHPAHLPRVPSSSHRICVTLRQRALWQRDGEIQQQIFAHQI